MVILVVLALFLPFPVALAGSDNKPIPIKRTILALHDQKMDKKDWDFFDTNIHLAAEMPLNHLGLKLVHRSVHGPLPSESEMSEVRGILTWFADKYAIKNPEPYCSWLLDQMQNGVKLVILEEFGFINKKTRTMPKLCRDVFVQLGAEYVGHFSDNTYFFEYTEKDTSMVEFERKFVLTEEMTYSLIRPKNSQITVHLKARRIDMTNSDSALVFTSALGGYAHPSYVLYYNDALNKKSWRLNPFAFFAKAFDVEGIPIPDTTTVNGKRLFYSHIDGDGIFNVSHIDKKSYSGETVLTEILKKLPAVPITVSIITGYLDYPEFQSEREMALYKNIFELPNVEPASHGYTHPLVWREKKLALKVPKHKYTDKFEIINSTMLLKQLLAKYKINKNCNLFLWTGDCRPPTEAAKIAQDFGLANLNGGDTRFDKRYDSLAFVYPLGLIKGDGIVQIYASNSNENTYTNLWKGPFYGYQLAIDTFANTGSPKRLKPINVYYHFYSAEQQASLKVLKEVYEKTLAQDIFPVFTGEYSKIARDFYDCQIFKLGDGHLVKTGGGIKTVRYDNEARNVDLSRSRSVLGFTHWQNSLYVHLDDSVEHSVYLTTSRQNTPHIIDASFWIKNFTRQKEGIEFDKSGWHKSHMKLGGLKVNRTYRIDAKGEEQKVKTNGEGILHVAFSEAENGGEAQKVRIQPAP